MQIAIAMKISVKKLSTFELLFSRQNRTFLLFNWEAIVVFSWFFSVAPKLLHDNTGENSNCLYSCQIFWKQLAKGQIISKCLFGVFNFFQKTNENKSHSSRNEFVCSFFGRIQDTKICFWDYLTFNNTSKRN